MILNHSEKYDFGEISRTIEHFYPIGTSIEDIRYFSYAGIKELEKLVFDNIHNKSHFKSRWTDFCKEIEGEIQMPIVGNTSGQSPCFSSFVLLETSSMNNLTRTSALHFYVSLIGPFFTVVARDNNTVKVGQVHYSSTNYLTISPKDEYAEVFNHIVDKIESRFLGYRFIPFEICKQKIKGLHVSYSTNAANTVFNALFKDEGTPSNSIRGNILYKWDDWIKEGWDGSEVNVVLSPPGL